MANLETLELRIADLQIRTDALVKFYTPGHDQKTHGRRKGGKRKAGDSSIIEGFIDRVFKNVSFDGRTIKPVNGFNQVSRARGFNAFAKGNKLISVVPWTTKNTLVMPGTFDNGKITVDDRRPHIIPNKEVKAFIKNSMMNTRSGVFRPIKSRPSLLRRIGRALNPFNVSVSEGAKGAFRGVDTSLGVASDRPKRRQL